MTFLVSPQQAKFTFYRCVVRLHWPLQHTLFCVLAWEWERSPSARHFLWACLVRGRMGGEG